MKYVPLLNFVHNVNILQADRAHQFRSMEIIICVCVWLVFYFSFHGNSIAPSNFLVKWFGKSCVGPHTQATPRLFVVPPPLYLLHTHTPKFLYISTSAVFIWFIVQKSKKLVKCVRIVCICDIVEVIKLFSILMWLLCYTYAMCPSSYPLSLSSSSIYFVFSYNQMNVALKIHVAW